MGPVHEGAPPRFSASLKGFRMRGSALSGQPEGVGQVLDVSHSRPLAERSPGCGSLSKRPRMIAGVNCSGNWRCSVSHQWRGCVLSVMS